VFVTGGSQGPTEHYDYATVAYRAATGAQRWAARYSGSASSEDAAAAVAVSPAGGMVFVTGHSTGPTREDYATVAYRAATGAQAWVNRFNTPVNGRDLARSLAVSPGGGRVFVTGSTATVAYSAAAGARVWVARNRVSAGNFAVASMVAVSPAGGRVYITGSSPASTQYLTIGYQAATGARVWANHYNGPTHVGAAASVAVSPNGQRVFVTGYSRGAGSQTDYATIGYHG
jgi:DNA-binding beta-propeller fold protein YncE